MEEQYIEMMEAYLSNRLSDDERVSFETEVEQTRNFNHYCMNTNYLWL